MKSLSINVFSLQTKCEVVMMYYLRISKLHEVVPDLFEEHDDSHLQTQINQTAAGVTLEKETTLK